MKVTWELSIPYRPADRSGEVEVADNASSEEIYDMVRNEVLARILWSWKKAE